MKFFAMMLPKLAGWENDSALEHRHLILAYAAVLMIQIGYAGWVIAQRIRLSRKSK